MKPPDFRQYIPVLVIVVLIVWAFLWATSRPTPRESDPVASLEEVRERGVVYLEDQDMFLVERGRGVLALSNDAQHIGDKVEWCESSQMFESPAHGEKFDRFGRYYSGPAATDMDRAVAFAGSRGVFLNGIVNQSKTRSRDTFEPAGPSCVPE